MPQTREHILLARQVGALHRRVPQQGRHGRRRGALELVEVEVRDLLSEYDFPGDDIPFVTGLGAQGAEGDEEYTQKIIELAEHLDTYIPSPSARSTSRS